MSTVFISDLHLDASQTKLLIALEALLQRLLNQPPQALYMLGDIFDAWVGDDDPTPWFEPIKIQLQKLNATNCSIYFLHGNRDFLVGETFCRQMCAELVQEPLVINLYGTPTALLHGDALCTQDTHYQTFKQKVRSPSWQRAFLEKPLPERRAIAAHLRDQSKTQTSNKPEAIMDVSPDAVTELFNRPHAIRSTGVRRIIHGHTHRPNLHEYPNQKQRWVLGDWRTQPQLSISYLVATEAGLTLHSGERQWAG